MEKYRKLKVIGKGSFGYAVLVQSVVDRQTYVMKVRNTPYNLFEHLIPSSAQKDILTLNFIDYRCV